MRGSCKAHWLFPFLWLIPLLLTSSAWPAAAQATAAAAWEIKVHGGGVWVGNPTDGTVSLPGAGAPFTGGVGFPPTRRVSSWYFGDGSTLVNQVSAAPVFSLPLRMTPLDPVLSRPLAERQHGGHFGIRVGRALTGRLAAEFSLDYSLAQLKIASAARAGIETSRASFLATFNQFQTSGSAFSQSRVTSTADIADGNARQIVSTGALNINLTTQGRLIPYATVGGGVMSRVGAAPRGTLVGNYQFLYIGAFPFNERDTVSVRDSRADHAFVGVFGGGVRWHASPRWGIRIDVRAHVNRNQVSTLVDADPVTVPGTPSILFFSTTNPAIYFSNVSPSSSSLTGPRIDGAATFKGSGLESQVVVASGVYWRF